jgi:tetratricopeptide (TPR) repeat protein
LNIKDINCNLIIFCLVFLVVSSGCSVERTNVFSKTYHNINARYNGYFIANEHLKIVEKAIFKNQDRNFNKILRVFPEIDSTIVASKENELDEVFKKASHVIQRHKNSKWTDDCHILIGKTRYYQQQYKEAVDFFKYVNVNSRNDNARHEALVFLMRTFVDMKEFNNARYVSDYLNKEKLNNNNTKLLALTRAYMFQQLDDQDNMVKNLIIAAPMVTRREGKAQMYFILGQLYQEKGFDAEAYKYYNLCLKTNPDYELSFYSKLNMAHVTELSDGSDVRRVRKYFRTLLKDRKNEDFKDKIYYEMAEFEFKQDNIEEAIEYYTASVNSSKNNPRQKAYSFLRLGEVHFDPLKKYEMAKSYYDSVVTTLPRSDESYEQIKAAQEVLADFVTQVNIIQEQDSLLNLAKMDSVQLMAYIDEFIVQKEKEESERQKIQEKSRKRTGGQVATFATGGSSWTTTTSDAGTNWYFYNSTAVGIGRNEFIRNWGNRRLEDNWRRSNKESEHSDGASFIAEQSANQNNASPKKETDAPLAPMFDKAQLFASVPRTDQEQLVASKQIEDAYYRLGNIYNFNLNEKEEAATTFETLISRFNESPYKPEALYLLYLIYGNLEHEEKSNRCKEDLISNYPNTIYAKLLINPNYTEESAAVSEVLQKMYKKAYGYFQNDSLKAAMSIVQKGLTEYPDNNFTDNLKLLEVLIIGKTEGVYNYQYALQQFIENYPDSDLNSYAKQLLDAIDVHKANLLRREGINFRPDLEQQHYFVVVYNQKDNIAERLIHRVNQFVKSHDSQDLKTANMVLDNSHSFILVNEFTSKDAALSFYRDFNGAGTTLGDLKNYNISNFVITKENFEMLYSTKGLDYYVAFFNKNYL